MAIGDAAALRGMDLVSGATPANEIDTEINKTRDYIAEEALKTQPVSRGGTGATTTTQARQNLNIYASNIPSNGSNVQADIDYLAARIAALGG